jgi:DNA-binding SARP family transcriptional activator/pimeloyl-ACP methyl ester carboxylesterase
VEFRLLGPLEVIAGAAPSPIASGKQAALLAVLLLSANRTVARDRIVDELWGADVPESAQKMVQIHVSQLRKVLPEPRLHTRPPGYLLEVGDDELDLARFERLVADGRDALSRGDAAEAAALLRRADGLWRGPALAEFAEAFARQESARLEELRLAALEWRIEAELALGRHSELVGELQTLTARYPLRERLRAHQLLALYRSGRHAEALASYQALRRTLDEELGIEPSPALRELERRILRQDRGLDPESASAVVRPVREVPYRPAEGYAADVRYARSGDVRIAYQVVGEGPLDLVLVHGWVCTFQPGWEHPPLAAFYRRLASLGRLILFDKRGTGLSDRISPDQPQDLETRIDDVRAVLDDVGCTRAVVLGVSEGGAMSALFSALYPERTDALVLMGTFARVLRAPDYPIGLSDEEYQPRLDADEADDWARAVTTEWLGRVGPHLLDDPEALRWYVSYVARGSSPAANRATRLMNREIDVRDVLPTIAVPTLVLYRAGEHFREATRYMGERIAAARVVELPGDDHLPWEGETEPLLGEIERFVTGTRAGVEPDRVLATLLHVDVPDGVAESWLRAARTELARFRGREVERAGAGLLATFDGPARAVRCGLVIAAALRPLGLDARAGVHAGEVEQEGGGLRGVAVDVVARIAAAARPGEVLVSGTVRDIVVGSELVFEERGERELDGLPGSRRVYAAVP